MIGRRLIRSSRKRSRGAIFVAMVPLVFLNGWPIGGCICADGHYEPFCRGCGRTANSSADHALAASTCCGHTCCARHTDSDADRSCCKGHNCCEQSQQGTSNEPGVRGPCCTPVRQLPVTPVVKVSPTAVDHHQDLAVFTVVADLPLAAATVHHGRCVEIDTGPPPNDLVVTLQRLII